MRKIRADIWILAALTLAVPVSCCDREDSMQATVTLYPSISNSVETEVQTRAKITVSGTAQGTTYEDDPTVSGVLNLTTLLAYAVPTETDAASQIDDNRKYGLFRYSNGKWRSHVSAVSGKTYNLYAISPNTLVKTPASDFNWGLTNPADYTTFSTSNVALTLHDLDLIADYDPLISIASAGRHVFIYNDVEYEVVEEAVGNQPQVTQALAHPALTKNHYDIGKVIQPDGNQNQYRVWMAMNHLYAKATIYFAVYQDYYNIRDIRLKEAKLVIDHSTRSLMGDHTYNFATSSLSLDPSLDANTAFGDNTNDNSDLEVDLIHGPSITKNNRDAGQEYVTLKPPTVPDVGDPVYTDFAWFCFLPQSLLSPNDLTCPPCTLKVKYDVVDKNGKMVREDQEAQNIIQLSTFHRDDDIEYTPKPGEHVKIKILVKPSYLYKLTDDDAKMDLQIQ